MNKKSGSLTKRQYEDYMIESNFNQFWSRTSMHSRTDGVMHSTGMHKYDSESTSNNDYRGDNIFIPHIQHNPNQGRQ
jgi:hypothetical protein